MLFADFDLDACSCHVQALVPLSVSQVEPQPLPTTPPESKPGPDQAMTRDDDNDLT